MTRRKRRRIAIIVAICAIILAALAGTWMLVHYGSEPAISYGEMEKATLPTITCYYNERQINRMYGYTRQMDPRYMRDTLYILQDKYNLEIHIDAKKEDLSTISFKVQDLPKNTLIQSTEATDSLAEDGTGSKAVLAIENMIEEEREYALEILLQTNSGKEIHYYSRIMKASAPYLADHIALITKAHNSTYDYDSAEEAFSPYKSESDYLYDDTTSFGRITLYSTISWLSWDEMILKETIAPTINIVDYDSELAFFRMDYQVGRNTDSTDPEYYNVSEYFRTRINETNTYLLDYERVVHQIFLPSGNRVSSDHINLGIQEEETVEAFCSPDGNQTAFVSGGALWLMTAKTKELTSVYNYISDLSDLRDIYDQHKIDIVNVTNDGDVRFLVYGYVNKGLHEGESGIGLYTFKFRDLKVTEDAFIPAKIPYQLLKNAISGLCYMNENEHLYIMINGNVYSIDPETNIATMVVSGLSNDTSKVSEDHSMLAWQEEGKINDATTIHVLNMDTLQTVSVSAEEGKAIKVLGFLNNELIYGEGDAGNTYTDTNDKEYLLMNHLYSASDKEEIHKEDPDSNTFFVNAEQEYNRLIVNRVYQTEDSFRTTEDFTVFATELSEYPEANPYTTMEETRGQVLLLSFPVSNSAAIPLNIITSTSTVFSSAEVTDVTEMVADDWNYLVYAKGRLISPQSSAAAAIISAYDNTGCVVRPDGSYFYRRGMRAAMSEISQDAIEDAIVSYQNGTALNVTGIDLSQAMTFTSRRIPLIWERNEESVYVIAGYTISDALALYDIETGETTYMSYNEADRSFTRSGRVFVYEEEN